MTLRRSFLSLLLIAGVAAAMVTVASMATFTDQVVSQDNELEAGTLYLSVNGLCADRGAGSGGTGGGDACSTESFDLGAIKKPGDSTQKTFNIKNEGSINGLLSVTASLDQSDPNSCFSIATDPSPLPSGAALASGATSSVTVTVSMPSGAGNACQAVENALNVQFDLVQAP